MFNSYVKLPEGNRDKNGIHGIIMGLIINGINWIIISQFYLISISIILIGMNEIFVVSGQLYIYRHEYY